MPEYLAPGVYVEEIDVAPHPIPGVSTSTDHAMAQALIDSLRHVVPPDWTGFNQSDPGITLINLFAFLTENLLYRSNVSVSRRKAAQRVFLPLLTAQDAPACGPLTRPHFFAGRLLDAATLEAEQNYQRDKLRRHTLALHGVGIVSGLAVQIDASGDAPCVTIDPGYGVDPHGGEVGLCERAVVALPAAAREVFVSLRRWERLCDPAPGPNGPEATRIEEASIIAISASVPETALALARLTHDSTGWSIDSSFARSMARS